MANYEYFEKDLPKVTPGGSRLLHDGTSYMIVQSGAWSMEYIDEADSESDSNLEDVEKTILAWIAYRNWLVENPPGRKN